MEYPVALELISSLRICDRLLPWKDIFNRAKRHTHGLKSLGIMRHCFLIGHKKGGPSPSRSSHILDPIPEGPDSVRVTFSRRSPNGGPGRAKTGRNPVRNGPGTLPVGHMYGVRKH